MWSSAMRASTSDRDRSWLRRLAVVALGGLVLAGCFVSSNEDGPKAVRFQHWSHISRGLECVDCHADAQTAGRVAMPTAASCRECHNDQDVPAADVAAAISEYVLRPAEAQHERPSTYVEVSFAHAAHVGSAQISCAA